MYLDTDKLQTYLGLIKGLVVVITDFILHATVIEGNTFKSPMFWLGLAYAVIEFVKGYFGAGVKDAPKPTV